MQSDHILKFVHNGPTFPHNVGIRTFPHHTYGVSKQSPDHFHKPSTLINSQGYSYRHENAPQFEYHSQQPSHPRNKIYDMDANPMCFHLKKGRLGQFADKNKWMKTVYVMTGDQRSERARSFRNEARETKIRSFLPRPKFQFSTIDPGMTMKSSYKTIEDIMSEKVRIRQRRNQQAARRHSVTHRTISDIKFKDYQQVTVRDKMAKTTKQWYPSLPLKRQLSHHNDDTLQINGDLQEWKRKTCRARLYNKKQNKMRRQEQNQQNQQVEDE